MKKRTANGPRGGGKKTGGRRPSTPAGRSEGGSAGRGGFAGRGRGERRDADSQERGGFGGGRGARREGDSSERGGFGGGRGKFGGPWRGERREGDSQERGGFAGGRGRGERREGDSQERGGYTGGRGKFGGSSGRGERREGDSQERGGYTGRGRGERREGDSQERGGFAGGRGKFGGPWRGERREGDSSERGGFAGGRGRGERREGGSRERGQFAGSPRGTRNERPGDNSQERGKGWTGLEAGPTRRGRVGGPAGRDERRERTDRGPAGRNERREWTDRGAAGRNERRERTARGAAGRDARREWTDRGAAGRERTERGAAGRERTDRGPAQRDERRERTDRGAAQREDRRERPDRGAEEQGFRPVRRKTASAPQKVVGERPLKTLERVISKAGIGSRTDARSWVEAGRVKVNGKAVQDPDSWVDLERDRVELDGKPVAAAEKCYLLLYKPKGYLTTADDPDGRPTVYKLLHGVSQWVFPVGRLDLDTSGLLLLTNDSQFAEQITNPEYKVPKKYLVKTSSRLEDEQLERLRQGVELKDGPTQPAEVTRLRDAGNHTFLEITITEGRNRQVRRMIEAVESKVSKLVRVSIGPIEIGTLQMGSWRDLTKEEVKLLRKTAGA